jgi:hypothetical protein
MAGNGVPAVVHSRLGALRWHAQGELLGSIDVDPAIRRPRSNGSRDVEVLLDVGAGGVALESQVEACAARIESVLADLALVQRYAVLHAPRELADFCQAQVGGSLTDLLFLDGIEVDHDLRVSAVFDFGDLDSLVVQLDEQGLPDRVFLRP